MDGYNTQPFRMAAETGLTIVELMISLGLGMGVVLATTALLVSSKAGYVTQEEGARLQETGRYALGVISRAVRQTAYENWDGNQVRLRVEPDFSPNVMGLDAKGLRERSAGIELPVNASVNGSDVLALRFFGSGSGVNGDGTMLNCAGFGVAAPASQSVADEGRGWSVFYVGNSTSGEPELRCKYRGNHSWSSEAIATGIESFQVLYGLDSDDDSVPNAYLTATAIDGLDDRIALIGPNAVARARELNRKTHWKKVVAVKVAFLVRAAQASNPGSAPKQYDLFGKDYADAHAAADPGTRIDEADLPAASKNRLRRIFTQTIQIRNPTAGGKV